MAMYQAKENGRNRVEFFSDELAKEMAGRAELERELRLALKRDAFLLQFQPQLAFTTGRIVAAEALYRWKHPERELLLPPTVVPLAAETGINALTGGWNKD